MIRTIRSLAIAAMLSAIFPPIRDAHANPPGLIVADVTLIDGRGGKPMPQVDLRIERGRIVAIGRKLKRSPGDAIIPAHGKYVIPGLIDTHVHLDFGISSQLTPAEKQIVVRHNPRAFLFNGVTTVLNVSSPIDWILPLRDAERRGELVAPRIYSTGSAFTPVNGWGSRHTDAIANTDQAAKRARDYVRRGVDGIKIIIENGLGNSHKFAEIDDEPLNTVIGIAREAGLPIFLHAINLGEYRRAIAIKPRAIVHGLGEPITAAMLHDLKSNGIAVVPTISLFESFLRVDPDAGPGLNSPAFTGSLPPFMLRKLRDPDYYPRERAAFVAASRTDSYRWAADTLPVFCANIRRMHQAGVKIGVGTDAGGTIGYDIQGYNTPWEMALLVKCGLSEMDAIVAATRSNAEIIGANALIGTVEVGKAADLLILSSDPLNDIRNVRRIDWIVKNGVAHPQSDFASRGDDR